MVHQVGGKLRRADQRFLCICQGGNVRSVALSTRLKQYHRRQAIAIGFERVTPETLTLLCQWATHIVVMMPDYATVVPDAFRAKVTVADVA